MLIDSGYEEEEINTFTPGELFNAVLNCEGIINYSYRIKQWVKDIYNIELE